MGSTDTDDLDRPLTHREAQVTAQLLALVESNSRITQRSMSRELGVALGLANAYLRRCIRKGLIKVQQAPLNRYAYYVTPRGLAEKGRLTAEYLAYSFNFVREARRQFDDIFDGCAGAGMTNVALVGDGELAEIAFLSAYQSEIEVVCVIDPASGNHECADRPVVPDLATALEVAKHAGKVDALIITDSRKPQDTYDRYFLEAQRVGLGPQRVLAPDLLLITRKAESLKRQLP